MIVVADLLTEMRNYFAQKLNLSDEISPHRYRHSEHILFEFLLRNSA
jgi:hypothetical protein